VWLGTQNLRWDAQRGSEVAIVSGFMTTIVWSIYFKFAFLVKSSLYNIELAM
jgi:hypothetical protein